MGQRVKKNKKKLKNKKQTGQPIVIKENEKGLNQLGEVSLEKMVTIKQKNDIIKKVDYFGFPPKLFMEDLKKTAVATIIIMIILVTIKFLT